MSARMQVTFSWVTLNWHTSGLGVVDVTGDDVGVGASDVVLDTVVELNVVVGVVAVDGALVVVDSTVGVVDSIVVGVVLSLLVVISVLEADDVPWESVVILSLDCPKTKRRKMCYSETYPLNQQK